MGLSQEALGELLGTSKQVISRYENGHRIPKIDVASAYAIKLGISLSTLNGSTEDPFLYSSFSDRLYSLVVLSHLTWEDFSTAVGLSLEDIDRMRAGDLDPTDEQLSVMAKVLDVSVDCLLGRTNDVIVGPPVPKLPSNVAPVKSQRIPLLGGIAAGEPILAEEAYDTYVEADCDLHCDYALRVEGDSMSPDIRLGDVVFIRSADDVDDGQIAAVLVDDSATLKRVYHIPNGLQLLSSNPAYPPMIVTMPDHAAIRILGKAVAFKRSL